MANSSQSYLLDNAESLAKEKDRLIKQAKILFSLEESAIVKTVGRITAPLRILDLGCGNAAYLSLLQSKFENSVCCGYERNADLITQAKLLSPDLLIIKGDLTDEDNLSKVIDEFSPNYINLRFVLQHLNELEIERVLKTINKSIKPGTQLVIVEPDDAAFFMTEKNTEVEELVVRTMKVQAKRGGDRTIASSLERKLDRCGFYKVEKTSTSLTKKTSGIDAIVQIILPMWRSYESSDDKNKIENKVKSVAAWLEKKSKEEAFDIVFPIFLFSVELY
jgi:trans-aconitate methyltransferase